MLTLGKSSSESRVGPQPWPRSLANTSCHGDSWLPAPFLLKSRFWGGPSCESLVLFGPWSTWLGPAGAGGAGRRAAVDEDEACSECGRGPAWAPPSSSPPTLPQAPGPGPEQAGTWASGPDQQQLSSVLGVNGPPCPVPIAPATLCKRSAWQGWGAADLSTWQ